MGSASMGTMSKKQPSLLFDDEGAGSLRHGQAEGIVMELTTLLMQRFDVVK